MGKSNGLSGYRVLGHVLLTLNSKGGSELINVHHHSTNDKKTGLTTINTFRGTLTLSSYASVSVAAVLRITHTSCLPTCGKLSSVRLPKRRSSRISSTTLQHAFLVVMCETLN